jgi:DNA modification methylase
VRSIEKFGFVNPVLIDERDVVVAGWGRVSAAKKLGHKSVPTLRVDHLTKDEKRAYVIADNQLATKAGWDRSLLALEIQGLVEFGFETEAIGFETAEIDILLDELAEQQGESDQEDVILTIQESAITKPGDIWTCGEHRLLCGDARDPAHYERLLAGERAAFAVTDPPFNLRIHGHVSGLGRRRHREFAMASGEMHESEFTNFLKQCFKNMAVNSEDGSVQQIFMDWRHVTEMMTAGRDSYTELLNICIWCKTNAGMGSFYRSQHVLIFVWLNGKGPHVNNIELGRHGRNRSNVWTYPGANSFRPGRDEHLATHPTVKPVALIADAIKDCSRRGTIILDPFIGSGTTLVVAEKTGRKARGIELDPHYVDLAVRRWQVYSGKSAHHAETGRAFEED